MLQGKDIFDGGRKLPVANIFDVDLNNQIIPMAAAQDPAQMTDKYRLRSDTVMVTGKVALFSKSNTPYLDLDHSWYKGVEE